MQAIRKTMLEAAILGALSLLVAFGANGVRAKDAILIGKNYFPRHESKAAESDTATVADGSSGHHKHRFQEIGFEGVLAVLDDPDTATGLNVLVDARNDEAFEEGHMPGAIQCDWYNLNQYIDLVVEQAMGAQKVIVYCNGGDCTDSISVCGALEEMDVPFEAIYLYAGGWAEWSAEGGQVATGRE